MFSKRRAYAEEVLLQPFQLGTKPLVRRQITTKPTNGENAAQKPATGQPRIELLGALFKQPAFRLSDLERRRVTEMAEIMQMVVKAFHFRQQRAQKKSARRNAAVGGGFDGLAIGERVRHAANAGNALRENDGAIRRQSLEAFLHAAMLEEQTRLIVQNCLADIKENEFRRLDDIGSHWPKRKKLHVGLGTGDFRNRLLDWLCLKRGTGRIIWIEWRSHRVDALVQDQRLRLRMVEKLNSEQIGDFALIPAH